MKSKIKTKRIAIIGLGLIGGSLAKILKKNHYEITGFSKSLKTVNLAKKKKVIDCGYINLTKENLSNVDVIFICTPLSVIPAYLKRISKLVKHEVIISDVGSTKNEICKTAQTIFPKNITFIGSHPMSGNENNGLIHADENLFKNNAWILTPSKKDLKTNKAKNELTKIIKLTGAKVLFSSPEIHDKSVAIISHLPILLSHSLCKVLMDSRSPEVKNLALKLASSGFRDTTRIASCNPILSIDLTLSNLKEIKNLSSLFLNQLKHLESLALKSPEKYKKKISTITKFRNMMYLANGKNAYLN